MPNDPVQTEVMPRFLGFKVFRGLLAFIFLHAGIGKLAQETPEWFVERFSPTFLIRLPGGIHGVFHLLGAMETVVGALMAASIVISRRNWIRASYFGCLIVFFALLFGARISGQYADAASLFGYFVMTLLVQAVEEHVDFTVSSRIG